MHGTVPAVGQVATATHLTWTRTRPHQTTIPQPWLLKLVKWKCKVKNFFFLAARNPCHTTLGFVPPSYMFTTLIHVLFICFHGGNVYVTRFLASVRPASWARIDVLKECPSRWNGLLATKSLQTLFSIESTSSQNVLSPPFVPTTHTVQRYPQFSILVQNTPTDPLPLPSFLIVMFPHRLLFICVNPPPECDANFLF